MDEIIKNIPDDLLAECYLEIANWHISGRLCGDEVLKIHRELTKIRSHLSVFVTENLILLERARRKLARLMPEILGEEQK